jgi:hypothetical protein
MSRHRDFHNMYTGLYHVALRCLEICATVPLTFLVFFPGRNSSSVFFALHFFYGAGALLSPILAKPFLKGSCSFDMLTKMD